MPRRHTLDPNKPISHAKLTQAIRAERHLMQRHRLKSIPVRLTILGEGTWDLDAGTQGAWGEASTRAPMLTLHLRKPSAGFVAAQLIRMNQGSGNAAVCSPQSASNPAS
jgi:hypothetical protein